MKIAGRASHSRFREPVDSWAGMISRADAELVLQVFAEAHGIDGLRFDENNGAVVEYGADNALIFEYAETAQRLVVWAPLFSLAVAESAEAETALLRFLLSRNFPASGLDGAALALEEDLGMVFMAKTLYPDPAQPAQVVELVERFAQQALEMIELVGAMDFDNAPTETLNLAKKPADPVSGVIKV
ncbi:MAG: type III secretion system chaperone [Gammaproteobacteria bacterium]|nr:type III secretion system chaperone [Gammaproteobacteria bacterium]